MSIRTYRSYLGDGVYVSFDGDHDCLVLTTEDGIDISNTIYLDGEVLAAFEFYLADLRERIAARHQK
jgi:hypothetical protein